MATKDGVPAASRTRNRDIAEPGKHVELFYELAVALATVTEGAARPTVLKVTRMESPG